MAPRPAARSAPATPVLRGITVTHPERVVYPDAGLRKIDVVRYYDSVAEAMLPHLVGRPLTLKQCAPDAAHCRYLRHSGERAPAQVRVVHIQEKTKVGDYMVVDDVPGLIALAQRNMVEFHTWNSSTSDVERPDRVVLDLDPGPEVPWREVVAAARLVRQALQAVGLESWVKTTGGAGLHVVAPIRPAHDWSACLAFARSVAETLVRRDPAKYTTRFAKAGRSRQVLVDYLRNNRTNTAVAAWSARARPGATVSMPIAWDELTPRLAPSRFTVRTAPRRLRERVDPWAGYFTAAQALPPPGATDSRGGP
jgi:bifunctional non-homologous end joining protein LigD